MLHYTDVTAGVAEKKTVRKEQRVKPSVSAAIARAASAVGMDESAFIVSAAYEKAVAIEASQFSTSLAPEYFDAFAKAVNAQGKRVEGLAKAKADTQGILQHG